MVIAFVVIALLLVGALVATWVALTRTRAALAGAQQRAADTARELAGTAADLDEERAAHETTRQELAATTRRAESAEQRADTAEATLRDVQANLEAVIEESTSVSATLEQVRAELEATTFALSNAGADGADAGALWALEIARSERRWQLSVAPGIDLPSPFDDTVDALKLAVEVEASALREEVGTDIEVAWELDRVLPDEASLLVLRLAQELLADAAARAETLELRVAPDDDGVALELRAHDEDGVDVPVLLPELSSGRVRPSDNGWIVTRA